jgi:hypothetical protein
VEEDERVVEKKKGEDKEGEVGPTYSLGWCVHVVSVVLE